MAVIDFSSFTLQPEQIQNLKELLFKVIVKGEQFGKFHSVYTGVRNAKDVGIVGQFGNLGRAGNGCNKTTQTASIPVTKKTWSPTEWHIYIEQCLADITNTIARYSEKIGIDRNNPEGTDVESIVLAAMEDALNRMAWRIAWFNDTAEANYDSSPAGHIKDGNDATAYNIIDGFFAQFDTIIAADANRKVTIAENAESTFATQKITQVHAFDAMEGIYVGATGALKGAPNKVIYGTAKTIDAYVQYKVKTYGSDMAFKMLSDGNIATEYMGIPVYGIRLWDEIIETDFTDGTKWYRPHRLVFTTKDNLGIALDGEKTLSEVDSFFDRKTDLWILKAAGMMDAKILQDDLVQVAL